MNREEIIKVNEDASAHKNLQVPKLAYIYRTSANKWRKARLDELNVDEDKSSITLIKKIYRGLLVSIREGE